MLYKKNMQPLYKVPKLWLILKYVFISMI